MAKPKMNPLQKAVVTWLTAHPDTSQRALAEKAGVDSGSMSRIVSGEKPSLAMETAGRLAEAMGLAVEDLLAGRASPSASPEARVIDLALIDPSPHNPRKTMDEDELKDLAASIAEQGLLQPLVVMGALGAPGRYELIAGHRRLRALEINKATEALCIVRPGATTASARALQIIENLQRVDIPPLEEAQAFAALQDESPTHWTAKAIARAIGKSDRFVSQRLAIARNLAPELKERLGKGELKVEVARVLAAAPIRLQTEIAKSSWAMNDAQATRQAMHNKAVPASKAAFKPELYDGAWIEDGDTKWFADAARFDKLQKKAAEARVEKLKKDWPSAALVGVNDVHGYVWADDGSFINSYYLTRTEAKTRCKGLAAEDCTALVLLKDHDLKVLKNVVKREVWNEKAEPEPAADDDESGDRARAEARLEAARASQRALRAEIETLNARLSDFIASRVDIAKRLVIYGFIGILPDFQFDGDIRPLAEPWAERLAAFLPNAEGDGAHDAYDPADAEPDALWAILAAQDEATIDAMLARFLSGAARMALHQDHASGLVRALASAGGIAIPDKFLASPSDDEADEDDDEEADPAAPLEADAA